MDSEEVAHLWEANAEAWTTLARQGYDVYRDHLNTPAFMAMLPEVSRLEGLDIGCGEGHNTRLVAELGARMTAVDIAPTFIRHAREQEEKERLGIKYLVVDGADLPFEDEGFDFAVALMSLMDMADAPGALREAYRVVRPGGFFQFSICHPCFGTPRWKWVTDESGERVAVECGDYFREVDGDVEEWIFGAAPQEMRGRFPKFRIPRFTRTLSLWMNLLTGAGFRIEHMQEPFANEETGRLHPEVDDTRVVAFFLHVRCTKP